MVVTVLGFKFLLTDSLALVKLYLQVYPERSEGLRPAPEFLLINETNYDPDIFLLNSFYK